MDELLIDLRKQDYTISDRYPDKDTITLEDLLRDYSDIICENQELQEKIDTMEENIRDYYVEKSPYSVYGVNPSDFH